VVFIESKVFTRRLHELAKDSADSVLIGIQSGLLENPVRGDMVKGLGGVRKARISNPSRGKGKRGGFRYMYLYLERRGHVHLLFLFDKDEQEDLNPAQRFSASWWSESRTIERTHGQENEGESIR